MTAFTGSPTNLAVAAHVPTGTELTSWYQPLQALTDPWTSYAPAWTATGTAPAIGNGTLTGQYVQTGKMVTCRGCLTFGSTTTPGTNTWIITLPVAAVDANQVGIAMFFDQSTNATRIAGAAVLNTTSNMVFYAGNGGVVTNTTPFGGASWATSDRLIWQITYEAA